MIKDYPPFIHSGDSPVRRYAELAAAAFLPALYVSFFRGDLLFSGLMAVFFTVSGILFGSLLSGRPLRESSAKYIFNAFIFILLSGDAPRGNIITGFFLASFLEEIVFRRPVRNPFPPFLTAFVFSGLSFGFPAPALIPAALAGVLILFITGRLPFYVCVSALSGALVYYFTASEAGYPPAVFLFLIISAYPGILPSGRKRRILAAAAAGCASGAGYQGVIAALVFSGVLEWF